jgi:methionyl-tRNA formyltransferase
MSNPINKTKIIFLGTPDFAAPSLKALINDQRFEVIAVVTQPDKKIGRKQIVTPPPIKVIAGSFKIPVLQPDKFKEVEVEIKELQPDVAVVVAYGQIIPKSLLNLPKYGYINVHGSLLPKYRGAACVQAPILNGDQDSGVTIMQIDAGLDTGSILSQNKIQVSPEETTASLHDKLSELGANVLPDILFDYILGKINPIAQNNSLASYVPQLTKEDGRIDWNKSAIEIERMVRALNPWPGVFSQLKINNYELRIKILEVKNKTLNINKVKPGNFFIHENELAVQCGQDSLIIEIIQPEGKKSMTGKDFIQGYKSIIHNS